MRSLLSEYLEMAHDGMSEDANLIASLAFAAGAASAVELLSSGLDLADVAGITAEIDGIVEATRRRAMTLAKRRAEAN